MQPVEGLYLFKFGEDLQTWLEIFNKRKRAPILTTDEAIELTVILELDGILTLLNAKIIAELA